MRRNLSTCGRGTRCRTQSAERRTQKQMELAYLQSAFCHLRSAFYDRGGAMSDCLFCGIVAGAIPSERVFEGEDVVAVRDINPQAPVHVLLLPKKHIASALDAKEGDGALLGRIPLVAVKMGRDEALPE